MNWFKDNKKPLLIVLAAFAGIIAVTAVVAFFTYRGAGETDGAPDAPYPYEWTEADDGTIALTLSSGGTDGVWSAESANSVLKLAVGKPKHGKTAVTITPLASGREAVVFALTSAETQLAELNLVVESVRAEGGNYAATVASHRERVLQATVTGGDAAHPFTVSRTDEGLTIHIADTWEYDDPDMTWTSESSDGIVAAVLGTSTTGEGVDIELEARAVGSAEITVSNPEAGLVYIFDVQVSGGEMLLTDSRTEAYEEEEETVEFEPVEDDYGDDYVPEEADPFDDKAFTFTPRSAAGMRLDLAADDTGSRTIPQLYHAYRYVVQQWRVTRVGTAELNGEQQPCYRIVSIYNGQTLDGGDGAESLWFFEDAGDDGYSYLIPTSDTAKCLTARGTQDGAAVTLSEKTNGIGQRWQLTETVEIVELGTYTLSPRRAPELALALAEGASGIGAKLALRGVSEGARWTFTRLGIDVIDGVETPYCKIINADSGLAIDVPGTNAVTNGKPLQQWYYDDNDDQLWYLEDMGDGYYVITSRADRNVLLGTAVQTWEKSGDDAQQWKLTER